MKKYFNFLLITILTLVSENNYAQNLVPNYSFEIKDSCPFFSSGQLNLATPWLTPTDGSPDYFNACSGPFWNGVPTNDFGNQSAKDGISYAGLVVYFHAPSDTTHYNAREYIQAKLTDTLHAGKCYHLTFFVSIAEKYDFYKITNFGAYFSNTAISNASCCAPILNYTPQINYVDLAGIGDTIGWYKVEGTFLADGGEQYITLGNFNNDINTTAIVIDPSAPNPNFAYYYIDSISLIQVICPIEIGINENLTPTFHLFPNPVNENLNIQLDNFELTTITIYNALGANVLTKTLKRKSTDIDISFLDNGVYIVSVINGKGATRQKIIKNTQ